MTSVRRFAARRSPIHGRGVFALVDIPAGAFLLEYAGEIITADEAQARYERTSQNGHTYLFERSDALLIDGGRGGNSARFINHGCAPNVEAFEDEDGRILIHARRRIRGGAELLLDYRLTVGSRPTKAVRALYACGCGARTCRGTMLAA